MGLVDDIERQPLRANSTAVRGEPAQQLPPSAEQTIDDIERRQAERREALRQAGEVRTVRRAGAPSAPLMADSHFRHEAGGDSLSAFARTVAPRPAATPHNPPGPSAYATPIEARLAELEAYVAEQERRIEQAERYIAQHGLRLEQPASKNGAARNE